MELMSKKKHRSGMKPITTTQKELDQIRQDIIKQSMILTAAYLMDVEGYGEDQIVDFWESLTRWIDAIDAHLITIDTVTEIIEKTTGLRC